MAKQTQPIRRRVLNLVIVAGVLVVLALASFSLFSSKPDNIGVSNGRLAECPDADNCVSSQATGDRHRMEPIAFSGSSSDAIKRIKAALGSLPRTKVVEENENYLHAEARSLIFRFVDDIEFYIDTAAGLIHFRSAARAGYSDFGVNRSRMEKFREAFKNQDTDS